MSRQVILNVPGGHKYRRLITFRSENVGKFVSEGESHIYEMLNTLLRLGLNHAGEIDRFDIRRFTERMFDRMEIRNGKIEVV